METETKTKVETKTETHKYIDFFYESEFLKNYFHQKK